MSVITDALKAAQREKARRQSGEMGNVAPVLVRLRAQPRRALNRAQLLLGAGAIGLIAVAVSVWMRARADSVLPALPAVTSAILSDALADTGVALTRPIVQQAARVDSTPRAPRVAAVGPARAADPPPVRPTEARSPANVRTDAPREVEDREPSVARVRRAGTLEVAVEAPRDAEASRVFAEAVAAHRAGDIATARPLYERVLALAPHDGDALNNLGVILSAQHELERALDLLRRAAAASPRNAGTWNNIGAALREQGKSADAIVAFRQALSIDPAHQGARVGLAQLYMATNAPERARELLLAVLQSNPALSEAHYTLGQVHEQLGDRTAAAVSYSAFIRYAPARLASHVELVRKRLEFLAGTR